MSAVKGIFGMGNPLLDITAVVDSDFLTKYDVQMNNAILAEETHMPIYEEMKTKYEVEYTAGGACQNTIRVATWMLQGGETVGPADKKLKVDEDKTSKAPSSNMLTTYVGCVGDDENGKTLRDVASKDGVKVHYMQTTEEPTGMCAVLVQDKERSLVTNLCAANKYSLDHLEQEDSQALMKASEIFYVSGFFLTVSPESALAVAAYSAESKKTFTMNLSAPFIVQVPPFLAQVKALMPQCDILFANESEAVAWAESMGWEENDVAAIAVKTASLPYSGSKEGGRTVIFTQGSESTVVATAAGSTTYAVPVVPKEEIVDVNGAGDSFVGGFLAHLAQDKDMETCVNAGHYAAGVIIRASGIKCPTTPPTFK